MTPDQPDIPHSRLRCSDAEREQTAAHVHEAVGEGRLTVDEAEERLGQVYRARYTDELAALTADLPAAGRTGPAGWAGVWAALRAQILLEAAILAGRVPAALRRRAAALLLLLGPALLLLGGTALLLRAGLAWHDGYHFGPGGFHRSFGR